MRVVFVYYRYLDDRGTTRIIGGVETYLEQLANLCISRGWTTSLVQCAACMFTRESGPFRVTGINTSGLRYRAQKHALYQAACELADPRSDILVFGADHCSVPNARRRSVAIQHGISWDVPFSELDNRLATSSACGRFLESERARWHAVKYFENVANHVCVDYNFLNWYRTVRRGGTTGKTWVIPNATRIGNADAVHRRHEVQHHIVKLIFARRFERYRGTRLFTEVAHRLLQRFPNLEITCAGEGPDNEWMRSQLVQYSRVKFVKYLPEEALDIHLQHDVAVIPSIGSEGTSFSVAEAMAAGCAVVATAVGGITNMIIDGYNGILVMPEADALTAALARVIGDTQLRQDLSNRAYNTAKHAFSLEAWGARWLSVIDQIASSEDDAQDCPHPL